MNPRLRVTLVMTLVLTSTAFAQLPESVLDNLQPRSIGPATMGGRTIDYAVYEENPDIFYAATASGGLLKTVNGGTTWENVFDRQAVVSIGDVAINPYDPNEVWVGTGEANSRQSSSWGGGIYKSTDGGKTWKNMGLRETHHIGRIVVNPLDTNTVYVAALGHLWGPNLERGVYMTTDGGLKWQQVLAIDADTGVVDIAIDPANPKVLYAGAYQRRRSSFAFNGGGPHGGIYKTSDGGQTWRKLTKGLPEGDMGRIGLSIYRKNPDIVYAIVQNENGGVFRSEDKGESWTRMSSLNPRPMYYSQIRVDPNNDNRIYVLGTNLHVSDDRGKTFRDNASEGVHLDHHALWINPRNSRHLIIGNDGGIWVSRDQTASWEHLNNVAIGQFYMVSVDMQKPYWIYGGMQDNASWGGPSAVRDRLGIRNQDWVQMLACDGMYILADPKDRDTIYTNCQNGRIVRYDRKTGERKAIMPQPGQDEARQRWNWTTPIVISPHDSSTLFTAGNKVFKSDNRGHGWTAISDDVTKGIDRDELQLMGVFVKDFQLSANDGISSYGNVTALSESPLQQGLIYVGTDDGNVHVTRDGGKNWTNITDRFPGVPDQLFVSRLTPSAFDKGTVYASFDGHRSDNFEPYVYASKDFGQTWASISANLPTGSVYTIKEDTKNANLLYLGTEFGLFVSLDRGGNWTRWKSVGTVAVYDLVVHPRDNDLILGTHGRSFLVFDDITPLQQLTPAILQSASHLFTSRPATQFIPNESGWFVGGREFRGPNPAFGAYINYHLGQDLEEAPKITIMDTDGTVVRELEGPKKQGLHRVAWDLRTEPAGEMSIGFYQNLDFSNAGALVIPGMYQIKLTASSESHTGSVQVMGDPMVQISDADRKKLFDAVFNATRMQKTARALSEALQEAEQQHTRMKETLKEHPNAAGNITDSVEKAGETLADLRKRLLGERGQGRFGGGDQPLQRRIGGLKSELAASQTPPTEVQTERGASYSKELEAMVNEVNAFTQTTLPGLYEQMARQKIWPMAPKVNP